jgi:hypothetical protein
LTLDISSDASTMRRLRFHMQLIAPVSGVVASAPYRLVNVAAGTPLMPWYRWNAYG